MYLASHRSEGPLLREECSARRAIGIEVECWDDTEVRSQFSFSRPAALVSPASCGVRQSSTGTCLAGVGGLAGERVFSTERTSKSITPAAPGVRLQTDRGCKVDRQATPSLRPATSHRNFCRGTSSNSRAPMLWQVSRWRSSPAGGNGVSSGKHCGPTSIFGRPTTTARLLAVRMMSFHSPTRRDRRVDCENRSTRLTLYRNVPGH